MGAFIECYCQPGELYNLTATYLAAIDEPQSLDYSYNFEVYITDTEEHRLSQGLFFIDNVIYSHGSPERLPEDFEGELTLSVTSELGDHFTATTTVPAPICDFSAYRDGKNIVFEFESSSEAEQNYYAVAALATFVEGEEITTSSEARVINPACSTSQSISLAFKVSIEEAQSIEVSLLRLTREGYLYQRSVLENLESITSNVVVGTKLEGNIDGCHGIFTSYTKAEQTI